MSLAVLLILGLVLRLLWLSDTELWWDEFLTIHRARLPLGELWHSLNTQAAFEAATDTSPPLHHIIVHFFLLLGHHEGTVKLASVLFGTASLAMAYAAGSRLFGRLAGLFSAGYLALSQYHIAYSRDLRWYPFFFFFSLASLYTLTRCVAPGRLRDRVLWVLSSAGMLYTSYIAAPFLMGEAVFAAMAVVRWRRLGQRETAWRFIKNMAWAAAGLILVYLPQLPGHLVTTRVFYKPGRNPAGLSALGEAVAKYAGFWQPSAGYFAVAVLLIALAGGIAAWRRGYGASVLLVLLWGGLPTCAAFLVNVSATAQAKYFPGLFLLMALFAGAGLAALAEAVARHFGGGRRIALAAGLTGLALLAWPNLDYREFYRPARPTSRQWAQYLASHAEADTSLVLERNRQRKVILDWYYGGQSPLLAKAPASGYHRFTYLGSGASNPENLPTVKTLHQGSETVTFARGGVVGESPLPLVPDEGGQARFAEDFTDFSIWRHAALVDNLAPDYTVGRLALAGFDAPGSLVYAFGNPTGARIEAATLDVRFVLRDVLAGYPPDTAATIDVRADGSSWRTLETVNFATFLARDKALSPTAACKEAQAVVAVALPEDCLAGPGFSVRLTIRPGGYGAAIEVAALSLRADFAPHTALRAIDPAMIRCRNIVKNATVRPFDPAVRPLEGQTLYGFSPLADAIDARLGSPEQLRAYQARHAAPPVARIVRPDGFEVCRFYDPLLRGPELSVTTGAHNEAALTGPLPATFKGLRLDGEIADPVLRIGQTRLDLGLALPKGSVAQLNPGDTGLVTFSQSFAAASTPMDNMIRHDGLAAVTAGKSVSCESGKPCDFAYLFASRLPITGLRLTMTPWVSPAGDQSVTAYYSVDGTENKRTLLTFRGQGQGRWEAEENLTKTVALEKPASLLYVGFTLSGDGAKIEATDTYPLRIEVTLDARRLAPPTVGERVFPIVDISAYPNAYRLLLSRNKLPF